MIITNRGSALEDVTRQNLVRLGLQDDRRKVCVLGRSLLDKKNENPDEWEHYGYKNDKDRRRRLVREGNAVDCWLKDTDGSVKASWNRPNKIVLWIGDNILDMPHTTQQEAHAGKTPGLVIGRDYFLLPNPLYGSWTGNQP